MSKFFIALVILVAAASAIERVSDYISPPYFHLWVNNTQYLYKNETADEYLLINTSSTDANMTLHATVIVNNSHMDLGWDYVYVSAENAWNETDGVRRMAYYHAGMAEGWATAERIWQVWLANNYSVGDKEATWIQDHIGFMKHNIVNKTDDPFWNKVGDLFALMEGIAEGFSASNISDATHNLTAHDIFLLNFGNEYGDVQMHCNSSNAKSIMKETLSTRQHCSALVKHLPQDIFFSHDTWSNYNTMLRQYKTYAMETIVTMSGFAGMIASGDDWYMTNNSLAVQETTNDYYDPNLAVEYVLPQSVSEFLRVMVANFNTAGGKNWTEQFARYNSGTYCNQYMVLDAKLFTPMQPLEDDLFWVAEQMPGNVTAGDQTTVLREQGYWASYNIPFYKNIYDNSGFARLEKEQGTFWSHKDYARAEIFARNQSDVRNLDDMRKMMRFNEWQTDPLSKIPNCSDCTPNSPYLTIASRGDLVPHDAILPADPSYSTFFTLRAFGDIDSKITSALLVKQMTGTVICGPTHETQEPFQYSKTDYTRPPGVPDLFDFDWVTFTVPTFPPPPPHGYYTSIAPTWKVIGAVIGVIAGAAIILAVVVFRVRRGKSDEATYEKV